MRHLIPQSCCSDGSCVYACGLAGHRRGEIARGETKRPRNKFTVIADMLAATAAAPKRPGQHTVQARRSAHVREHRRYSLL
jgi:hypothetical protein